MPSCCCSPFREQGQRAPSSADYRKQASSKHFLSGKQGLRSEASPSNRSSSRTYKLKRRDWRDILAPLQCFMQAFLWGLHRQAHLLSLAHTWIGVKTGPSLTICASGPVTGDLEGPDQLPLGGPQSSSGAYAFGALLAAVQYCADNGASFYKLLIIIGS